MNIKRKTSEENSNIIQKILKTTNETSKLTNGIRYIELKYMNFFCQPLYDIDNYLHFFRL